jgi:hypothetical protein
VYEGDFVQGQFHGYGKYNNPDKKRVLEGLFKENQLVEGKMFFEDGSYYEGEFKKDMMHGKGSIFYPNGNVYVGTFLNDKHHGTGTLFDILNKTK